MDTIRTAASAGRMYITIRSLPELQYDIPRPDTDAPRDRIAPLWPLTRRSSGAAGIRSPVYLAQHVSSVISDNCCDWLLSICDEYFAIPLALMRPND